ncbi:HAMP domain-containing protein [Paenibacillus sp. MMS18-CY102]|nr:HAMP domain-containing protein [Paenibacillus sp. MMS18-CY102]
MWNGKHGYISFHYKLFISYFLLVITPITVIGSYSYVSSINTLKQHTRSNLEVAINQINNNVQYRADDVIRVSNEIYADQLLSQYLAGYYLDWERYQVTTQYVLPRMETVTHLPKLDVSMTLYLNTHTLSEYYYDMIEKSLVAGERYYEIRYIDRIKDEPWYQSASKLPFDGIAWEQVGTDAEYGLISLLRPLINYDTLQPNGLIRIRVKLSDLFEEVKVNQLGSGTKLFILNDQQKMLYANMTDTDAGKNGFTDLMANKKGYLRITKTMNNLPSSLVALIPVSSFTENSEKVRNVTILICLLSFIILTFISLIVANMLSKRILKLKLSLKAFKDGEFHRRIYYRGKDEFAEIADSFNDMASTTQKLIDEVYISKLEKKEAELQILHAQINPHFLYNTFSSISRMAKLGEIGLLHEIIRALAKFYRLTLNKGEMLIPVDKELQIINAYLDIQNMKCDNRIHVELDVEEGLENYETVKFILQPFVENVLEHAWYDDEIHIGIRVYRSEGAISMEIRDNGLGMKQETIDAIFSQGPGAIGYGIRNVDQRIKLHYGREYGVTITSEIGVGTTVVLQIPYVLYGNKQDEQ